MTPSPLARVWESLRHDLAAWRVHRAPPAPPAPGLHTYRVTPPGGTVRLHLRVDAAGAGALFVDVTEVVHLNATAVYIVYLALEEVPADLAETALRARYPGAGQPQIAAEVAQLYAMVERFRRPDLGCPTCALAELPAAGRPAGQYSAPFSTPVSAPFKADLALTYGCNNACGHCYNEPDRLGMPSLTAPEWRRVIDTLHRVGVPHLIFTGGEATLHPDLPELIAYADGLGHLCGLNSNGRRLAQPAFARTLASAGLNHIQITLASHRAEVHDAINGASAFRQTLQGLENAQAAGLHTITNTTLLRANAGEVEALIEFLYDHGLRTFALNGLIYSGGGFAGEALTEAELAPILVRVRDRAAELGMRFLWYTPTEYCRLSPVELEIGAKRCNAGEYSLCVEPNGDVLPCQSFYVSAGNLLRDPWDQIWHSGLFHSFRDREDDPQTAGLPEKCWDCPDLPLCGGGCRLEREARAGQRTAAGCGAAQPAAAGFTPNASLTRTSRRATGRAPVIALDDLLIID
ncbi:MAG: radical SAM protein [Anaerolineales bacterium]|nr:radical SAM protein [Anaerolineales bacterium]